MADIFVTKNVQDLFRSRKVLLLGDSNMRALYKDLLWLLQSNSLIDNSVLKRRLEFSCLGDKLIKRSELTKGRDFMEHRLYKKDGIEVEYMFITRCFNDDIVNMMNDIKAEKVKAPSVIIMGSALWDLTRWGPDGPADYRKNMLKLMELFRRSLSGETLVLWTTAPPTASEITGGLIIKQIEFMQEILRFEILSANQFAAKIVCDYGYDVVDFHYYLQSQIYRRSFDGVHYLPLPVRLMTNLLLTHICISWDHPLPGNVNNKLLISAFNNVEEGLANTRQIENLDNLAKAALGVEKDSNMNLKKQVSRNHKPSPILAPARAANYKSKANRNRKIRNQNRNFKPYNRF